MKPRRGVLAVGVERWLADAAEGERRTVVVRLSPSAEAERAAAWLRESGATVQTAGQASVVCVVTPPVVRHLAEEPWIVAIEEPRRLFPREGPVVG